MPMLPKPNRLPSSKFVQVLRRGKRVTLPAMVLVYQANDLNLARFGFVVSAKIDKRATGRNRMKRLLREAVRLMLPQMEKGTDGVIVVRKSLLSLKYPEVERLVKAILFQARVLRSQY